MPDTQIMNQSICFSPEPAETLNNLAFKIDKRLFLFANYEPKPYIKRESGYSTFRTAVINMYGLLKDCGPDISYKGMLNELYIWNGDPKFKENYHNLKRIVSAFRTYFCHNCSQNSDLNEYEVYSPIAEWTLSVLNKEVQIPYLKGNDWYKLLETLVNYSNKLIADLNKCLTKLYSSPRNLGREQMIDVWIRSIAEAYIKKDFF